MVEAGARDGVARLVRATTTRVPVEELVIIQRGDMKTLARAAFVPHVDTDGAFTGATLYFDPM